MYTDMIIADAGSPRIPVFQKYADPKIKKGNVETLERILRTYNSALQSASTAFNLPVGVIAAFIATESSGIMQTRPGSRYKGLMQVAAAPFYDAFTKWDSEVKNADKPDFMMSEISRKVSGLLRHSVKNYNFGAMESQLANALQSDATFNIMAGCAVLRWNIERFGGLLNKAIIAYNAGPYNPSISSNTRAKKDAVDTAVLATSPSVPMESRDYLSKMVGPNGFVCLIYKDQLVSTPS